MVKVYDSGQGPHAISHQAFGISGAETHFTSPACAQVSFEKIERRAFHPTPAHPAPSDPGLLKSCVCVKIRRLRSQPHAAPLRHSNVAPRKQEV